MPGKPLKFPDPKDYPAKDPVILCPAERVIGIYNQANGKNAVRIAKNLKEWFAAEAKKTGGPNVDSFLKFNQNTVPGVFC